MEKKIVEKILYVDGMTCTSCENRIEKVLSKLQGVTRVKASFANSKITVVFDENKIDLTFISNEIKKLDYKVRGDFKKTKNTASSKTNSQTGSFSTSQVVAVIIVILAVFLIINNTVGFNYIPEVSQNMGFGLLFVIGLLTSLHCIAMCGGINLSQCVKYNTSDKSNEGLQRIKPSLLYNSGRVVSYTIIGGIVGGLGSAVSFSGGAKGIVAIISGIFMVIMGLNMLNVFPWLRKINPRLPRVFTNKIREGNSDNGPFVVGLLNGLMPCGPLQAMQLYALGTGSVLVGASSMFFFSLGTVPLMFAFGALSTFLSGKFTRNMMKASAVLVMILGIVMLNRGFALNGVNPLAFMHSVSQNQNTVENSGNTENSSNSENSGNGVAKLEGNIQVVEIDLQPGSYAPIVVQKGIPVKFNIKAESGAINGCNGTVVIPNFNVNKRLEPGDNFIEFTPTETGDITYSCWMGMIVSNIKVVDDITKVSNN